jgi:perosamine synthetase
MNTKHITAFPRQIFADLSIYQKQNNNDLFSPYKGWFYSSARSCIYHGVREIGLHPNDVVLVPSYHCGVEIEALLRAGLHIKYYTISRTMQLEPQELLHGLTAKPQAVYIIHYWGFPQDLSRILPVCRDHNVPLIEDCAHALYTRYQGAYLGAFGEMAIYSLGKTLAAPDGGFLRLNGKAPAQEHVSLRTSWSPYKVAARHCVEVLSERPHGPLAFLTERLLRFRDSRKPPAAMHPVDQGPPPRQPYDQGISLLSKYVCRLSCGEVIVRKRQDNYRALRDLVSGINGMEIACQDLTDDVCPLFLPILVENRDALQRYLTKERIETYVFGRNLHPSLDRQSFRESQFLSDQVLGIPLHQDLDGADMARIASVLRQALQETQSQRRAEGAHGLA